MEKKQKFIYWFIGLGCGMMLSGLVITFVGLNTTPQIQKEQAQDEVQVTPIFETQNTESSSKDPILESESVQDIVVQDEENYKWVTIPSSYSATEISTLLESEGVIKDAEAFSNYVHEHEMSRKLRSGEQYLPINGEYDVVLKLLTTGAKN